MLSQICNLSFSADDKSLQKSEFIGIKEVEYGLTKCIQGMDNPSKNINMKFKSQKKSYIDIFTLNLRTILNMFKILKIVLQKSEKTNAHN